MRIYKVEIEKSARYDLEVLSDFLAYRRMVSHNKKWVYIFHIEGDVVVVDRICPAKMIAK